MHDSYIYFFHFDYCLSLNSLIVCVVFQVIRPVFDLMRMLEIKFCCVKILKFWVCCTGAFPSYPEQIQVIKKKTITNQVY